MLRQSSSTSSNSSRKYEDILSTLKQLTPVNCSEACLTRLRCVLELRNLDFHQPSQIDVSDSVVNSCLTNLADRLQEEGGWTGYHSGDRAEKLRQLKEQIMSQRFHDAITLIGSIQRKLQTFDVAETLQLIEKAEQAAEQVEGKDIVLLFGNTGCGKSTTTHFLCGSTMEIVREDGMSYLTAVQPRPELAQSLRSVRVGKEMHSETRYITAVTLENPAKLFEDYTECEAVVICDAPGFMDTNGAEVDVANAAGLVKAAQKAKSVRPVLIIGADSGGRFENVRALLRTIVRVVPNISEHLSSFSYIFTKFDDTDGPHGKGNIPARIRSILKEPVETERADENFMLFVKDMARKNTRHAFTLNPLKDSPGEILMQIMERPAIKWPHDVFIFGACEESMEKISSQITVHRDCMIDACKRSDVDLLQLKLDELVSLNDALQIASIAEHLEMCKSLVVRHLRKEYDEAAKHLNRCMADSSDFTNEDAEQFQASLLRSKSFTAVSERFGLLTHENFVGPKSFKAIIDSQSELLKESIMNLKDPLGCPSGSFAVPNGIDVYTSRLAKLRRLSGKFGFAATLSSYGSVKDDLSVRLKKCVESVMSGLEQRKFDIVATSLDEVRNAEERKLHEHLDGVSDAVSYEELVHIVRTHFEALPLESTNWLATASETLSVERGGMELISLCLETIAAAENTPCLHQHLPQGFISDVGARLEIKVIDLFKALVEKGNQLLKEQNDNSFAMENCFSSLGTLVKDLTSIRKLPGLDSKTSEIFFKFFGEVVQCLQQMKAEVEEVMKRVSASTSSDEAMMRHQDNRPDISRLPGMIAGMKKAQWMEEYREGVYTSVVKSIETTILQYARNLSASAHEFGIEPIDDVKKIAQILDEFEYLEKMESTIPGLEEMHKDVKKKVTTSMEKARDLVKALFSSQGKEKAIGEVTGEDVTAEEGSAPVHSSDMEYLDADAAEDALRFILVCKEVKPNTIRSEIVLVHGLLKNCMNRYIQMVGAEIKKHFGALNTKNQVDIDRSGLLLHDALQEAKHLKESHPNLFKLYTGQDFVVSFLRQLKNTWNELNLSLEDISRVGDVGKMDGQLRVVRTLWRLDEFMESEECKFLKLYMEYGNRLDAMQDEGMTSMIDLARKKEFRRFMEDLRYYGLSSEENTPGPLIARKLARLRGELTSSLFEHIHSSEKKARHLGRDLPVKEVLEIMENWRTLQEAKAALELADERTKDAYYRFMDQDDQTSKDSLKNIMQLKMQAMLSQMEQAMSAEHFIKADSLMAKLIKVKSIIGPLCSDEIASTIENLEEMQERGIEGHIENYKKMDLKEYPFHSPREFFARFESAPSSHGRLGSADGDRDDAHELLKAKYSKQLGQLYLTITEKIQNKINVADLRPRSDDLNTIEIAIRSLPDGPHKENLEKILEAKKERYETSFNEQLKSFESALASFDKSYARGLLAPGKCDPIARPLFEKDVRDKLLNLKCLRFDLLEKAPCSLSLGHEIENECTFFFHLVDVVSEQTKVEILAAFEDMKKRLESVESAACISLLAHFGISANDSNDPRFRDVQAAYNFVSSILMFRKRIEDSPIAEHLMPKGLGTNIRQLQNVLAADYEKRRLSLMQILSQEPLDQDFDFKQAAVLLQTLKQREDIYISARRECSDASALLKDGLPSVGDFLVNFIAKNYPKSDDFWVINEHQHFLDDGNKKFYELLGKQLGSGENIKPLIPFCEIGTDEAVKDFSERVKARAKDMYTEMSALIESLVDLRSRPNFSISKTSEKVNSLYCHLDLFKKYVGPRCRGSIQINMEGSASKLQEAIVKLGHSVCIGPGADISKVDLDQIASSLVEMKRMADGLVFMKQECLKVIKSQLDLFQQGSTGKRAIAKLAIKLRDAKFGPEGTQLVNELDAFKGYTTYIFNAKTNAQNIEYVLTHKDLLKSDGIDAKGIERLRRSYEIFENEYASVVLVAMSQPDSLVYISQAVKRILTDLAIKQEKGKLQWTTKMTSSIPSLVAHLFAMWTVHHSNRFLQALDPKEREGYLHKPHPSQVIAIFRMFGVDNPSAISSTSGPKRNLVQVKTGEGKTAILAITACVFALFQIEVSVACYSEYLSNRDFSSVKFLFDNLQIAGMVTYCTLTKLCENEINKKVNIRERLENLIAEGAFGMLSAAIGAKLQEAGQAARGIGRAVGNAVGLPTAKGHPRVLLVDEVDVFFSEDFYGNMYTPVCDLKHECISEIVTAIWRTPNPQNLSLNVVKRWPSYARFSQSFKGWEFLLDSAITHMILDVRTFESHEYCCIDGRIGYKDQDTVVFNISYGYKTIFAYLREHDKANISKDVLEKNLDLLVACGNFLFAKFPDDFELLMGATGTLECLSDSETEIVQKNYKITQYTYMPSVYGDYKLDYSPDRDVHVIESAFFPTRLDEEIEKSYSNRAVLVFFENAERLRAFQDSNAFKSSRSTYKEFVDVLTEESPLVMKEDIIRSRATASSAVTFLTRSFGRGTDFVCSDENVNDKGGVLVIQTFLSESASEEIQIKGRTARQGENGSFRMILDEKDMEKFHIADDKLGACKASGMFYKMLDTHRQQFFKQKYSNITDFVSQNHKKHVEALSFVDHLKNGRRADVQKFLTEQNPILKTHGDKTRILVLLDATASMEHLFVQAKNTVGTMFDRAEEILREHVGETLADVFEMQIAIYRNYNSEPHLLLQHSSWDSNPRHLRTFLDGIYTNGGWGHEAIEVALQHANNQVRLSQVILIGDAAANSELEVTKKRGKRSDDFWVTKGFRKTTSMEEIVKLKQAGVPLNAFYVSTATDAKECFDELALRTNGKSSYLDILSGSGAADLTNCITEVILSSVGGTDKGEALVDEYKKRYCKKSYRG